jgi:hypothetical protein
MDIIAPERIKNFIMKQTVKQAFLCAMLAVVATACHKVADLPLYQNGKAPVISASSSTVAPLTADSLKTAISFSWTSPRYATDSSNVKYIIQIDSAGRNFTKAVSRTVNGRLSTAYLGNELNAILLGYGFNFGVAYDMDVRVLSSYANNNEQYISNTIRVKMTPYKTPPKVAPPASKTLFLVGNATAGGWNNPVPVPAQQFTRVDSVTYQGTFNLPGGGEYLLLPVNGSWDHKYAVASKSLVGLSAGGDFGYDFSDNIPGPSAPGLYKITVDFQRGKFTVSNVKTFTTLYVPGNYQGWDPSTAPIIASVNADGNYQGYLNIPTNTNYEFKFTNVPNWNGTSYGDGGSGTLVAGGGGNLAFPGPGYFQVKASTGAKTWSVLATTWAMIGDFNSWGGDAAMTYDANAKVWKGTITAASAGAFKFRANGAWDLNFGDTGADGSLEEGGDNINLTAGTHTITLDLHIAGNYTYSIQ